MLKNFRSFIIGFMACLLFSGVAFAASYVVKSNQFPVFVDGVKRDVSALNVDGYTYLKLADFDKAGLVVQFNKDKQEIDITTKGETAVSDTQTTTQTDVNSPTQTPDGLKVYYHKSKIVDSKLINGDFYYIALDDFYGKYKDEGYSYDAFVSPTTFNVLKNGNIVLENAPRDGFWVEYDYYVNTILPLLETK